MTPAINLLKKEEIPHTIHKYKHDPKTASYGLEAAEKLGLDPNRVFKTLVVETDTKELAVAILPVNNMLNLKKIAKALGAKKSVMANPRLVEKNTGYILGGVSPLGQKKPHKTTIDSTAKNFDTIFISAGRRGLDIEINPGDLEKLTSATLAEISD